MKITLSLRKVSMLVALIALFGSQAFANDKKDFNPARKVERLKQELSLSDEQAAKIRTILDTSAANFKKWQEQRKQTHDQISAVLTPEQLKKFEAMKQNMKARRKERMEKGWQKKNGHKEDDHENESDESPA